MGVFCVFWEVNCFQKKLFEVNEKVKITTPAFRRAIPDENGRRYMDEECKYGFVEDYEVDNQGNIMCGIPTIDMAGTGRNIVKLRESAGMSVRDLQEIFGFATPNAIYKWQKGLAMPTVDNLIILAAIFGVSVDDIIAVNLCTAARISA